MLTRDGGRRDLRRGARGGAAARVRGGRPDRGRLRRGRRGEDGDPRDRRLRVARRARRRRVRRDRGADRPSTSPPRASWRWRCGWSAPRRSSTAQVDVRVGPALVDRHHPLAAVEGAFNAVMLQGDAIREITLEGPGAGGIETASAVVADMVSVIGTTGTGFLQNDAVLARRSSGSRRASCARRSTSTSRSTTGRACSRTSPSGWRHDGVSVARLVQQQRERRARPSTSSRTRRRPGASTRPLGRDRRACPRCAARPELVRVIAERGVWMRGPSLIERYRDRLPVDRRDAVVSLGEGSHAAPARAAPVGAARASSSGSSGRARTRPGASRTAGMAVAISQALERGRPRRSSARRPGTRPPRRRRTRRAPGSSAVVLQPAGAVALGEAGPGARRSARGCSRCAARSTRRSRRRASWPTAARTSLVNSLNPHRIEGQKTAAFEIVEELGGAPDVLALPYGGGGNTCAYARGLRRGRSGTPRLVAVEAARAGGDGRLRDPHRRARARAPRSTRRRAGRRRRS